MTEMDEQIGRNFARMRGDRPQSEIASAMRERGYKWSQATVWAVEKGERPLRLSEAFDLDQVLGTPAINGPMAFLASTAEMELVDATRKVVAAHRAFEEATSNYLGALDEMAITADTVSEWKDVDEVPGFRWYVIRDWLETHSPVFDALAAEQRHRIVDGGDAQEEMADRGVKTYRDLVKARDDEAREAGFEDYETMQEKTFRDIGNYSGLRRPIPKQGGDNGEHPEAS